MFESDLIEEIQFIRTEIMRLNDFLDKDLIKALSNLTDAVRELSRKEDEYYFINPEADKIKELIDEFEEQQEALEEN